MQQYSVHLKAKKHGEMQIFMIIINCSKSPKGYGKESKCKRLH